MASTGEEALELVSKVKPSVAIIDASLPGMGPAVAARRMRELSRYRLETVAVASFSNVALLGEMVSTGTAAYVLKGKPDELVAAVRAVASGSGLLSAEASRPVLEDMHRLYERERDRNDELETVISQLEALSVTDWLTGLKNHGYFFERLNEELERARRYGRPLAVLMADLDDFKGVNDAFGHNAGNAVLRSIGEVLRTQLREVDVACRVGGEEFGMIMPETDAVGAMQAAERIRLEAVERTISGVTPVTISLGVAVFPDHATNRSDLVEAADRALYTAKSEGKNRTILAGETVEGDSGLDIHSAGPVADTLLTLLQMRAPELARYAYSVSELATALGEQMKLTLSQLDRLAAGSLLHDVGMLAVPDYILTKPGPLVSADWDIVRKHSRHGFELVSGSVHPDVAAAVLSHHERIDGSGYPQQLRGEAIPILARVMAVADAYQAMTSERPYRQAMAPGGALEELRGHAGSQFDPAVVVALTEMLEHAAIPVAEIVPFRREVG